MKTEFVCVFRAADEPTANIVKAALENAGIAAVVRRYQTSWLDGALVAAEGSWGEVLVSAEDLERASAFLCDMAQDVE